MNHVNKNMAFAPDDYQRYVPPYYEPPFSEVSPPSHDPKSGCIGIILGILLAALLLWLLPSCASSKHTTRSSTQTHAYSTRISEDSTLVSQKATEAAERSRNSVERRHDTVIVNTTTIIREVDSAELSRYGIQLANQRRAYLIQEKELRERISSMQLLLTDSMRVQRDSLRSLQSRYASLLETSKSSVEESATSEVRKKSPPLWPIPITIVLTFIIIIIYYTQKKH